MENMLEEVNWCKSKMKKHFNKPLNICRCLMLIYGHRKIIINNNNNKCRVT